MYLQIHRQSGKVALSRRIRICTYRDQVAPDLSAASKQDDAAQLVDSNSPKRDWLAQAGWFVQMVLCFN